MGEPLLLGIDTGTTAIKAALFTTSGSLRAAAARVTPVRRRRRDWSECEMDEVWQLAAEAVRELVDRSTNESGRLMAVGLTGNMGGAWLVDANGAPVRPAILWNDGRMGGRLRAWHADGTLKTIYERSLSAAGAGFTLPLLLWLRENEPAALARVRRIVFAKDWVRFCLTGEWATDASDLAHVPGDAATRYRSLGLLEKFGLEDLVPLFPPLREMTDLVGTVSMEAARKTGLPPGLPVVTGAGDVTATVIGMDATAPGQYSVIAGTSCLINLSSESPPLRDVPSGITFLTPGGVLCSQPNQTGASAVEWAARLLWDGGGAAAQDEMQEAARQIPPGAEGLLVLPYFSSTGLISPIFDPAARGQMFGLGVEHGRAHIARAVFEGLALAIADGIAHLPGGGDDIRMAGGLARSAFWCQLVADVTGKDVRVPSGEELGALGACILAAVGIGLYPGVASAQNTMVKLGPGYAPVSQHHRFYRNALDVYQAVQRALVPVFPYRERLAEGLADDGATRRTAVHD